MKQAKVKLEIKQRRCFSEEFKKARVKDLVEKRMTVLEVSRLHEVSPVAVYKWLYKYSVHHQRQTTLVVQMESEATKTKHLLQQVADLERIIGQKQLEIDFLSKLLEIGSEELGFDLKKISVPNYRVVQDQQKAAPLQHKAGVFAMQSKPAGSP